MGAKRKERDKNQMSESEKKWWKFSRKSKIKPTQQLDIQHNVNLNQNEVGGPNYGEMTHYQNPDNHFYK